MDRAMRRFFVDPADIKDSTAIITGQEVHHLKNVLRLNPGDRIEIFDGTGTTYLAVIDHFTKDTIRARVVGAEQPEDHSPRLIIGQALLTGKKMDLIVQKATELGIHTLWPFVAEHCSRPDIGAAKGLRRDRIILEACKQCGRPQPMNCPPPIDFDELLVGNQEFLLKLIFWENEQTQTLQKVFQTPSIASHGPTAPVLALIGPEGGFSISEVERAVAAGFEPVTLGPRVLRAETAAIAVMAILQFLLGNLSRES